MNFIDAAEEIVQITHDILVSAHQEKTKVIRFKLAIAVGVELMHRQRVANIAQIDELVDLPVGIAGNIHERAFTRGTFLQTIDWHDREKLSERPMVQQRLK